MTVIWEQKYFGGRRFFFQFLSESPLKGFWRKARIFNGWLKFKETMIFVFANYQRFQIKVDNLISATANCQWQNSWHTN